MKQVLMFSIVALTAFGAMPTMLAQPDTSKTNEFIKLVRGDDAKKLTNFFKGGDGDAKVKEESKFNWDDANCPAVKYLKEKKKEIGAEFDAAAKNNTWDPLIKRFNVDFAPGKVAEKAAVGSLSEFVNKLTDEGEKDLTKEQHDKIRELMNIVVAPEDMPFYRAHPYVTGGIAVTALVGLGYLVYEYVYKKYQDKKAKKEENAQLKVA